MKHTILEDIKQKFIEMCDDKHEHWTDVILYMLYSEYPIGTINEELGDLYKIKENIREEYDTLWGMQPKIEEDEEKAFAIQHVRDLYDILLGETGDYYV